MQHFATFWLFAAGGFLVQNVVAHIAYGSLGSEWGKEEREAILDIPRGPQYSGPEGDQAREQRAYP